MPERSPRDDHDAIRDVLVRFARALDEKDWDGYAALYAVDGVLTTPRGTHRGRAGLARFVENDLGTYSATHHVSAGHDVRVDGTAAAVRCSLQATHVRGEPGDFWTSGGWYDVTLRREGVWVITTVLINVVWRFDTRERRGP